MKNFIQNGNMLTLTAPAGGVTGGLGYVIGALFGVAAQTAVAGTLVTFQINGVVELPRLASEAWTEGQIIYWDATNLRCTTTATNNTKIGAAATPGGIAANAAVPGWVKLNGTV